MKPWQRQYAEMKFGEAARNFADAELRIRQLAKAARDRNCHAYEVPDASVGVIGGRCKGIGEECAECAAIDEAWRERARMRKVRGLARRRMLRWREKEQIG